LGMGGNPLQEQIFDGKRGMMTSMGQKQEITGDDLKELELQSTLFPELNYEKMGYSLELSGIEKPDGEEAFRIKLTGPTGKVSSEFYSVETGLKLRSEMSQETPMGVITIVTLFSDYKDIGGVKFPHNVKQQAGPQNIEMKVSSIQINTGLDDSSFTIE
jgi:zinc protease